MNTYLLYSLIGAGCLGSIYVLVKIGFLDGLFAILESLLESLTD